MRHLKSEDSTMNEFRMGFLRVVVLILATWTAGLARAQAPNTMNFTGTLLTPDGQPRDGTFNLTFRVFPVPAGGGAALHAQTINGVVVRRGQFSVVLSGFTDGIFRQGSGERYLEVQVGSETPILPRQHLVSAPFALRAASLDGTSGDVLNVNGFLDTLGRMRVRGAAGSGGGVWFTRSGTPTTNTSFIGRGSDAENFTGVWANNAYRLIVEDGGNVNVTSGDLNLFGKVALRGNDGWLRLNQDGAFTSGVHVPSLFAPVSVNVGGIGGYVNPGSGNQVIAGSLGVGTPSPGARLDVAGDARITGSIQGTNGPMIYSNPYACAYGALSLGSSCSTSVPCQYGCGKYICTGVLQCNGLCGQFPQTCFTTPVGRLVAQ
jgi:hypothetical protein